MSVIKVDYGEIEGGSLTPTKLTEGTIPRGQTTSVNIDLTKSYIICGSANIAVSSNLMDVYACIKGTVTQIVDNASAFVCTPNGNTLTLFNGAGADVLMSYAAVQLD